MSIAVDFDGTLSEYHGFKGVGNYGKPVPEMLRRVKAWILHGEEVVIFTARASTPEEVPEIKKWLNEHGIGGLRVTNQKDYSMKEFWDDLAVRVEKNTGKVLSSN